MVRGRTRTVLDRSRHTRAPLGKNKVTQARYARASVALESKHYPKADTTRGFSQSVLPACAFMIGAAREGAAQRPILQIDVSTDHKARAGCRSTNASEPPSVSQGSLDESPNQSSVTTHRRRLSPRSKVLPGSASVRALQNSSRSGRPQINSDAHRRVGHSSTWGREIYGRRRGGDADPQRHFTWLIYRSGRRARARKASPRPHAGQHAGAGHGREKIRPKALKKLS